MGRKIGILSKRWRVLAPASAGPGICPLVRRSWAAWSKDWEPREQLVSELASHYSGKEVILVSSGTEALYWVFRFLRETKGVERAVFAAYNCPDLATAAINAGLSISLLDIDSETLEMSLDRFVRPKQVSKMVVVFSNLFGLPDRIEMFKRDMGGEEYYTVDDACQSALSRNGSVFVGARSNHSLQGFGVLSFGRGKAIAGIGGGAIIADEEQSELGDFVRRTRQQENNSLSRRLRLSSLCFSAAVSIAENPLFYRLPACLPGLVLGNTVYHSEIERRQMTAAESVVALARMDELTEFRASVLRATTLWANKLGQFHDSGLEQPFLARTYDTSGSVVPIRYPILFASRETREKVWKDLSEQGLGASRAYNCLMTDFSAVKLAADSGDLRISLEVAARLITLPVHRYVDDFVVERTLQVIERHLS